MAAWWSGLTPLNQAFWAMVALFTTLFVWQLAASVAGLVEFGTGDADVAPGDLDTGGDALGDGNVEDAHSSAEHASALGSFRLVSVRSVLAFLTLFSWAGALYLGRGSSSGLALFRAVLWGLLGMAAVAALFWAIPRLTEEGTMSLSKAIGLPATVYVNIPRQGTGQVRVLIGNRISYLRARSSSGYSIKAGTAVRVVGVDGSVLEVEETG